MKHILKIALILIFYFQASLVFSQTGSIKGSVTDTNDIEIPGVNIVVSKTVASTTSDIKGMFILNNIPVGKQTISIHFMGFKTIIKHIEIVSDKTTEINLKLLPDVATLKEVTIKGVSSISGMGHIDDVHDGIIYAAKKNEVLLLDSMDANTAQNNPRQVLGRIPGSNYSETEGGGFPSNGIGFRGLNPTQSIETNTRQNGYNITADLYGYPESYYLPPLEAIDRIEVTRGASSLQFGPQFGGVINYIIKAGVKDKPYEFTTEQTAGSFGLLNTFYAFSGTHKKWSYYTYCQYKTISGWRANSQLQQVLGFAKLEYKPNDNFKIGLEYSILRNLIHMSGGLDDSEFNKNPQQSVRARNWLSSPWNILALTMHYKLFANTTINFKSSLNISARNLVWRNEDGGIQTPDSISTVRKSYVPREVQKESFRSITNELRLLTNYNIAGIEQNMAYGVRLFNGSMKRQGGGPGSTGSNFDLNLYGGDYGYNLDFMTNNVALFIENTFKVTKNLAIVPGIRYEYLSSNATGYITDDNSSSLVGVKRNEDRHIPLAGLGIQYKTSSKTYIYANCSQAYRPTDYSNQTPIGVSSKIDPNLKDANGYNADLGWRGAIRNYFNFDISGFYLAYNNRIGIETLTDVNGNPYTYRTNVANSVHKGLESYMELNPVKMLSCNNKYGTISFFISYSYIDAKYVSGAFKGNNVEFAPKNILRSGITYNIKRFSTTFLISHTSQSFTDANNTIFSRDATTGIIPAYTVMDWAATLKIRNYNIKAGINNLADATYFTLRTDEYPGPGIIPSVGRSLYVSIGIKL